MNSPRRFCSIAVCLPVIVALGAPMDADAGKWARFRLCAQTTGKPVDDIALHGHRTKGYAWIDVNGITEYVAMAATTECSMIVFGSGKTALVIGSPSDVACKIHGGPQCAEEHATNE